AAFGDKQVIVEPERVVHALHTMLDETTQKYVEGYRDAVNKMSEMLIGVDEEAGSYYENGETDFEVESIGSTWGLKATNVTPTAFLKYNPYSGAGIKVAILDTGFDFSHPDFAGRPIISHSFITGETAQDGHGHGTHCTGTSCGPKSPAPAIERYGIAYDAKIYIGKVLSNSGHGADGGILAGINWAVANGCAVISMSLGAPTSGPGYSTVFESVAASVLAKGTLIVAAAGNDSSRPGTVRPVSHPANCPSIMAVGAVDVSLNIAYFSNGGLYPSYGAVDIMGPGVNVFSSTKLPTKYATWSGTSMATPHVAGIAALYAQATGLKGINLWKKLLTTAKPLPAIGVGLVQAPTKIKLLPIPRPIPRPIPFPKVPILKDPSFSNDSANPIGEIQEF
ncbi:S8 family peptidase, partial [Flavobacterium sp.]|uniref:S8 family peptidase n=1 Tax=Flavobacterium sp. TaxID=239 RepID=UPI002BC991CC